MDFIIEFVLGVAFFFVLIRIVKHMKNRKKAIAAVFNVGGESIRAFNLMTLLAK